MKKTLLIVGLVIISIVAKAEVEFAYEAGAELVSAYLWRGQYNGGLSFQPDLEVGYDGEHTSLRAGAWASIGATDWKFQKGPEQEEGYNPNTYFMPELDIMANFTFFGVELGMTHYQYFLPEAKDNYQTEVSLGYNFEDELDIPLSITWNTIVGGDDFNETEDIDEEGNPVLKRAFSSYLEIAYTHTFRHDIALGGAIGMSPWTSGFYGNEKFRVINLSLRLEKSWEWDMCSLSLFAQGSLNPYGVHQDKESVYIDAAGDDKLYCQTLNGAVGLGIWF